MWLLEHEGDALDGKRLWLRPGKRYLFGRTVAEPGQLAIHGQKANSVSRKHVTITVGDVPESDGENPHKRSRVTVEDLGSKIGTLVNGTKIKGETCDITQDNNTLKLGNMHGFRIIWYPVVLSYSFTAKELRNNPLLQLRSRLEQLDIKFLADYDAHFTTHVVSRKRNTAKGLQALINGRYIVNDRFVDAVVDVATAQELEDGIQVSALEGDFDGNWPDALQYLPPAGHEPVERPVEAFAPNPRRADIFEGYTFIFYDQKQYDSLLGPITAGKGKALLKEVTPRETQIDDFIRYVKEVAGEKELGEFEDGSEGKGVVVVRFLPQGPNPEDQVWFADFYNDISLRLDQRMIDQKDFLDAILGNDAAVLRQQLPVESQSTSQAPPSQAQVLGGGQQSNEVSADGAAASLEASAQPTLPRRRIRGPARSRFRGFLAHDDSDDGMPDSLPSIPSLPAEAEASQEGLFVSQDVADSNASDNRAGRKRGHSPLPSENISAVIDEFAPTAAQVKRRRIELGESPVPRGLSPAVESEASTTRSTSRAREPRAKKELDVLEFTRRNREEAEAQWRAEHEELATAPEDLDFNEIRHLQIQEEMELRKAPAPQHTREQDIANGRWNPAWNGRKNFKRFQQRGAVRAARPLQRIIVALEEVKSKGFGIGDDYWLEDKDSQRRKEKERERERERRSQSTGFSMGTSREPTQTRQSRKTPAAASKGEISEDGTLDTAVTAENQAQDEDEDEDVVMSTSRRGRATRSTQNTSQASRSQRTQNTHATRSSRSSKRPSVEPPARQPAAKRSRLASIAASDDDDDESDDELRFRFSKR